MPLVPSDSGLSPAVLTELFASLRNDLAELDELIVHPRGAVKDPASLATASELLRSARELLDGPTPTDPQELGRRANLAYAVMLSVIDLVKSHTDVPKVPRSSKAPAPG